LKISQNFNYFKDRGTFYERDPETGKIIVEELGSSQHKWAFPRFAQRTGDPQTSCWSVSRLQICSNKPNSSA